MGSDGGQPLHAFAVADPLDDWHRPWSHRNHLRHHRLRHSRSGGFGGRLHRHCDHPAGRRSCAHYLLLDCRSEFVQTDWRGRFGFKCCHANVWRGQGDPSQQLEPG